jgi:predicted nuclease with RNAse H fold
MSPDASIVAGIDVGGTKKGFHAVALRDGQYHAHFNSHHATDIANWCRDAGACAFGVDAPCRWSRTGRARPAERELMAGGIWCFSTPTQQSAATHPKNHFGWMLNGAELFRLLENDYSLFEGGAVPNRVGVCFETFPQAVVCALAGALVSAKRKGDIRRALLCAAGIDTAPFTNIDSVDAALCALTVHHFLAGSFKTYGDSETGLIVVPC